MVAFPTFVGSWPWPWPRIGSHCIPSCIARRPLPTYQISFKSKKLFVDGRTDVRTDGHLRPTNVIRSTRRSRPKNSTYSIHLPLISASLRLLILRILSSAWKQDIFHTDTATITHNICYVRNWGLSYFFLSLLRAEVQPTSGLQCWDNVTVQCASPGRWRELVGVCAMCAWRAGNAGLSSSAQLVRYL